MAPRRSWAKADNPFWSNHVAAWYRSALEEEHYCRKHDLSTASLMRWAHHLLSADDLRKRAEDLQKSRRKEREAFEAHWTGPSKQQANRDWGGTFIAERARTQRAANFNASWPLI